jgi:catechol 2,3-dioxygenase-like lactoylglutathione lyase family enzyme
MNLSLGRIGQIARTVKSAAESERWYRDVLGLVHLYTFGPMAFFDCAGTRLALMEKESVSPDESVLYLRVGDIAAACEQLKSRGVEFISAPHMIHRHPDGTEEWMAFFKDLEGRPLAMMSQVR